MQHTVYLKENKITTLFTKNKTKQNTDTTCLSGIAALMLHQLISSVMIEPPYTPDTFLIQGALIIC